MIKSPLIIFTHKIFGGGAEVAALQLAVNLKRIGKNVEIFCLKNSQEIEQVSGVKIFSVAWSDNKLRYLVGILKLLVKLFFSAKYRSATIVTFQTDMNLLLLIILLLSGGRKRMHVCERSDPFLYPEGWFLRLLRRWLYKYADAIICQTQYARNFFLSQTPAARKQVVVCKNILKVSSEQWVGGKELFSSTKVRMIFVGRLTEQKRVGDALIFLSVAKRIGYDCSLDIVGTGPERHALESMAAKLGYADVVDFVGYQVVESQFYAEYDVMLHPSVLEGMSNAVLEAMHSGLPVVVSSACLPMCEVVEDTVNGFSVSDFSDEATVRTVMSQVGNERDYKRLSAAAAAAALPFSSDFAVHEWSEVVC